MSSLPIIVGLSPGLYCSRDFGRRLTIMRCYRLGSRQEAVDLALRTLAVAGTLNLTAVRHLRESGWEGDLEEMRNSTTT